MRCVSEFYQFGIEPHLLYAFDEALLRHPGDWRAGVIKSKYFGSIY